MDEAREAVQRMQDHIELHLAERITLADLAKASRFSPWYAHRLFTQLTGCGPADYIRKLRLSRSALRLRDEDCRILDVAMELGFGSVDGYQRAFRREFGCNPGEYARSPVPLYLFTPYGVKYRIGKKESGSMEKAKLVYVQTVEKPARKALVLPGIQATDYWSYCEEVGCDVWGLLKSMPSLEGEPVCLWLPAALRKPGTSEYVQGVEVAADYDGPMPEGFVEVALPAATYLMFQGEPFEEEDYAEAIETLQSAIDRYDPAVIRRAWDDANPRIQLEPVGARGYIELRAIR